MIRQALLFDCSRGISGDMTVAALLDLGADETVLRKAIDSIPAEGFSVAVDRVNIEGKDCCSFDVRMKSGFENHDHDMDYLFGHLNGGTREPSEEKASHGREGAGHKEHADRRTLKDVLDIIADTDMTEGARCLACRIFEILAEAEAQAHGTTKDRVHFHEVGALDSIADIISVSVCMDNLDIKECIITELWEGTGTVKCAHGILEIPVPAVRAVSKQHGLVLHETGEIGEFVTPTGASVAAAIRTSDVLPPEYSILREGFGAGKRKYRKPGILKVMIIEERINGI